MGNSPVRLRARDVASWEGDHDRHSGSPATRHLCAGVYVDRRFRRLVLRRVHNDCRRRVAPSYGFDLVPVVRHAWRSWALDVGHWAVVVGCVVAARRWGGWLASAVLVGAVFAGLMVHQAVELLAELYRVQRQTLVTHWSVRSPRRGTAAAPRRSRWRDELPGRQRRTMLLLEAELVVAVVVAASAIAADSVYDVSFPWLDATRAATTVGFVLVAAAAGFGAIRQVELNANHRTRSLRPATLTRREQVIDEHQAHTCVVYRRPRHRDDLPRRGVEPAHDAHSRVGSGEPVYTWRFPLNIPLRRAGSNDVSEREHVTPPFRAHELVDRLRAALRSPATDRGAQRLPGLHARDRIYVAETDVSSDRSLLRGEIPRQTLCRVIDDHQSSARHVLEVSVPSQGGEIVTTVFLRVTVKGRSVSLALATYALTRSPSDYQVTAKFGEHGPGAVLRAAGRAVLALPVDAWQSWRLLEVPGLLLAAKGAAKDRTLVPRRFPIGTRMAVREETTDDWGNVPDDDKNTVFDHTKLVEQRILKVTKDFLEAHDVDTGRFDQLATHIVSSGILNMGGQVNVRGSAVGSQAQVNLPTDPTQARGDTG